MKVALRTKVFKICCALIALSFQFFFFFRLVALFYTLNLILFHFDRNINKCRPSLGNYLLFFCLKIAKNAVFALCCEISIAELMLRFNLVRKCRSAFTNCVALQPNQKVHCGSCATLQKLKKLNCAFFAALLLVEKIFALRF